MKNRKQRIKQIAQAGIFTGLAVSLGYLLFYIPNVELISSTIFATGWLFGLPVGVCVGGISFAIFSLFNPLGASMPPLFIAQVCGGIILGAAGSFLRVIMPASHLFLKGLMMGICGGVLTLIYDVITNIGGFIAFTTNETFPAYLASGIIFSLLHIVSNFLIFSLLLFPILNKAKGFVKMENL